MAEDGALSLDDMIKAEDAAPQEKKDYSRAQKEIIRQIQANEGRIRRQIDSKINSIVTEWKAWKQAKADFDKVHKGTDVVLSSSKKFDKPKPESKFSLDAILLAEEFCPESVVNGIGAYTGAHEAVDEYLHGKYKEYGITTSFKLNCIEEGGSSASGKVLGRGGVELTVEVQTTISEYTEEAKA